MTAMISAANGVTQCETMNSTKTTCYFPVSSRSIQSKEVIRNGKVMLIYSSNTIFTPDLKVVGRAGVPSSTNISSLENRRLG